MTSATSLSGLLGIGAAADGVPAAGGDLDAPADFGAATGAVALAAGLGAAFVAVAFEPATTARGAHPTS